MDKALLEYEMKKNGMNVPQLCEILKISRTAFYRKCNGKSEFTLAEIKMIVSALHLESPMAIFFADEVS